MNLHTQQHSQEHNIKPIGTAPMQIETLYEGLEVIFTATVSFDEYGTVMAGEVATVLSTLNGIVELILHTLHPPMAIWRNVVTLVDGEADDLLSVLVEAKALPSVLAAMPATPNPFIHSAA